MSMRRALHARLTQLGMPVVGAEARALSWAALTALVRRRHGAGADVAAVCDAAAGAPLDGALASREQLAAIVDALYSGWTPRQLADEFGLLMEGGIELDASSSLTHDYRRIVLAQPMHAAVPLISVAGLRAVLKRDDVSEVIPVDCRTEEEWQARLAAAWRTASKTA